MIHDLSPMKPILLVDVSMNNYAQEVLNELLKHDKELPEGKRNAYSIYEYKELQHQYFKRFYRICKEAEDVTGDGNMEEVSYIIMDKFEDHIRPAMKQLEKEIQLFLLPDMEDVQNIVLLRKMQMNSVLLQIAQALNIYYIQKKDYLVTRMFEINTSLIGKIDDRKTKNEYVSESLEQAKKELVNAVKEFQFESDEYDEMEDMQSRNSIKRGTNIIWSFPNGKRIISTKPTNTLSINKDFHR